MRPSYFIIFHTALQQALPTGGTQAYFTDHLPPRLFISRAAAMSALRWWRDGHASITTEWESTNEYGDGYTMAGLPAPLDSPANAARAAKRQAEPIIVLEVVVA